MVTSLSTREGRCNNTRSRTPRRMFPAMRNTKSPLHKTLANCFHLTWRTMTMKKKT